MLEIKTSSHNVLSPLHAHRLHKEFNLNQSETEVKMSGTKRTLCLLDVKDLMLLKRNLGYESLCPACQFPISEHSDSDFQAERVADVIEAGLSKKKQKIIPLAKAAKLVRRGKLCETMGCPSAPSYNNPGLTKSRFCFIHKEKGMINTKATMCESDGCEKIANYNIGSEDIGKFCFAHKSAAMINVKAQLCTAEGCHKVPSYNHSTEPRPLFCKDHCEDGMVDVKHITCETEGCFTRPHYNFPGTKKGRFCAAHKQDGMQSQTWRAKSAGVKANYRKYMNTCEAEGCGIQANFNSPGMKKARFCATHKDPEMKNVHERVRCAEEGCQKHPYFNHRGEKKGIFCNEHKEDGMLNVYSNKCEIRGCDRGAQYHLKREKRVRRCASHKEEGMVPGKKKRPQCEGENCTKRPTFYDPEVDDAANARFCLLHKQDGMASRNAPVASLVK